MSNPITLLHAAPYAPIEGQQFGELILSITKEQYAGIEYQPGHIAIAFSNCAFEKITIVNPEDILFPDISISFTACYIGNIEVEQVVHDKISLHILSSYVSGKIENIKLDTVQVMNCFIHSHLFLMHLRNVQVFLAHKNLHLFRWVRLLKRIGIQDYQILLEEKQSYHVHHCQYFSFITDFEDINHTLGLRFNLNLIYGEQSADQKTHIQKGYFTSVSMEGNPAGIVDLENVRIDAFYLRHFSPKEEVSIYDLSPMAVLSLDTKFEIHQCNLDNVWFDNVTFSKFDTLAIFRSKLGKTKFTGCTFSSRYEAYSAVENIHYPDQKTDDYYKGLYEMFLQLKNALNGTGNAYESQKFRAFSLRALHKIKGLSRQDRFLLHLNYLSNSHGLSIGRPFIWFVTLSAFFYVLYLWSLGRIFNSNAFDSSLIGYYFSFIDITHRNDFLVNKNEFTGFSLMIDYLGKLVISYLIYQFIAAFRKYAKKV